MLAWPRRGMAEVHRAVPQAAGQGCAGADPIGYAGQGTRGHPLWRTVRDRGARAQEITSRVLFGKGISDEQAAGA